MKLEAEAVEEANLGLAPLLDVVLLLLIFFLVTTSFTAPRLDLELPEAVTGAIAGPPQQVVEITADGSLRLDGEPTDLEALGAHFAASAEADELAEMVIRAADATRHGQVIEILDLARSHGLTHVGIEVAAAPRTRP